jgi:hypothetical protein
VLDILEPAQFAKELEPKRKLTAIEGVDRLKVRARFEQLRNLVSRVFNVSKYLFARFLRMQNEHKKDITLGPEPVLDRFKCSGSSSSCTSGIAKTGTEDMWQLCRTSVYGLRRQTIGQVHSIPSARL